MSLFPAYSYDNADVKESTSENKDWLTNNSFGVPSQLIDKRICSDDDDDDVEEISPERKSDKDESDTDGSEKSLRHKKRSETERDKKHKKKKSKKRKRGREEKERVSSPVQEVICEDFDTFCIDKTRRLEFLSYKTLTRPIKPRYHLSDFTFIGPQWKPPEKKKMKRYFSVLRVKHKESDPTQVEELDVIRKAEEFNKTLCPTSDVADWIAFVEFQDEFFSSQHIKYNSEKERKRAMLQKKAEILWKALSYNPNNEDLVRLWFDIGIEIYSADDLQTHIEKMLETSPESVSLWLKLIAIKQNSLALCTFPSVTNLYVKGINTIRNLKLDKVPDRDSYLLELLFHYCRFLEQCGHWEILWTIIKNTLHLNFGADLKLDVSVDDDRVKNLENEIISGKTQPIWVTWRWLEVLREGVHFLPVAEAGDYPQRCVSTDDIIEFVLYFHRDVHFRLVVTFITLLKVPLIPFTNTVLKVLFKNGLPWALDSPELILSSIYHSPAVDVKANYLRHATQVTRGPQYLRTAEGQSEFLELIQKTFEECKRFLVGQEKVFMGLWWLRFNRWLYMLDKKSLANLQVPAKKMKHFFKDFMKTAENRDNILFYCEYGLFEYDQGKTETSIKTLRTLILSRPSLYHLTDELEKAALCHVNKCLCEIYVATEQRESAVKLLINLGRGAALDADVDGDALSVSLHKFEHVTIELVHEMRDKTAGLEQLLVPQFSLEWISCYMWLLALTKSAAVVRTFVYDVCEKLDDEESEWMCHARETIWETTCVIFWTLERANVIPLGHVIKESLVRFPHNLKILSLLSTKKVEDHGLWWTFKQSFFNPPTVFSCVLLCCVALERDEIDPDSYANRLKSLFQQVALTDGKQSAVIHCLRLKFLFEHDNTQLNVAHVNAIESCPWNKSMFMTSISVLPNKLMELTDVMIEKELRVHVTPDEIQEMRD